MSDKVGLPPSVKRDLQEILAHAASQERTVIEFRTTETESGNRYFSNAMDITEHVGELEDAADARAEGNRQ